MWLNEGPILGLDIPENSSHEQRPFAFAKMAIESLAYMITHMKPDRLTTNQPCKMGMSRVFRDPAALCLCHAQTP